MPLRSFILLLFLVTAAQAAPDWKPVASALDATCLQCHSDKKTKGGVNLQPLLSNPQVEKEFALWEKVRQVVEAGEMPPEDADEILPAEKAALITWINASLTEVANRNAGDPGPVTLRRLTNFEYDNTIRDLTGQDYRLSKEFQPDGGGGEGFSNIGDVLFVSPQQLDKYLKAARTLADHATILPGTGVQFHPQRIGLRGAKQIKDQSQQALYVWYQKAATPLLPKDGEDFREDDYMLACWKWKHKDLTGAQSLAQLATDAKLILPFLENWWTMLHNTKLESRYLDLTRTPWHNLPPPAADKPFEVPQTVTQTLAAIKAQRRSWLGEKDPGVGVQRRQQDADGLRPYKLADPFARHDEGWDGAGSGLPNQPKIDNPKHVHLVLGDLGDGNKGDFVHVNDLSFTIGGKNHEYFSFMKQRRDANRKLLSEIEAGKPTPPNITPALLKTWITEADQALAHFGKDPLGKPISPKTLARQAPAIITLPLPEGVTRMYGSAKLDLTNPDADHATVQWTLTLAPPPDPATILPGILTIWKRQTDAARRTMNDFNRMKSAFPDVLERRLEEVANNLQRNGQPGLGVYYFNDTQLATILPEAEKQKLQQMRDDWAYTSPAQLNKQKQDEYHDRLRTHLHRFADRAWRRPITPEEKNQLTQLYNTSLTADLGPEAAAREVLVRILVSPHYLYKTETLPQSVADTLVRPPSVEQAAGLPPQRTADTPVRPPNVEQAAGLPSQRTADTPVRPPNVEQAAGLPPQRTADTPVRPTPSGIAANSPNPQPSGARQIAEGYPKGPAGLLGQSKTLPLDLHQLASRLSYLLWSSTPDWPLRKASLDGSLAKSDVRKHHVLRMLKDPKAAALAKEFAGQWLEFAGFAEKTTMDAKKFPQFTPELRAAMDQETRLFFENLIRQDRPVRDILLADYTYLNEPLARHYQIPNVVGPEFRQVSVKGHPRGGLLGMGSILAKTSRPHRTSPVLRGNWLLNAVLGTPVPPPPNAVPELQEHPEKPSSLRAQLEQHRADPACAACHNRIDPLGFALERFDPIGRLRQKDDLGQPLDTSASLTDGTTFDGFEGLRKYLATRQSNFTRLFSRKLLGYALGRPVLPSDTALLDTMQSRLKENDTHFSAAVLTIIESPQFQTRRTD
jgi:hypothetical protein